MINLAIPILQSSSSGASPYNFLIIGLMFLVFYFLILRPQMKKQKEEKKYQTDLKVGNWIVTTGGIHGRVSEILEYTIMLETNAGKLKVERSAISAELSKARYGQKEITENKK